MMEMDEYLEIWKTVEKMAHYLKDSGFDFVITARPVNPDEHQHEFIVSCTKEAIGSQ